MTLSNKLFVAMLKTAVSDNKVDYPYLIAWLREMDKVKAYEKVEGRITLIQETRNNYRNMSFYLSRVSQKDKVVIEKLFEQFGYAITGLRKIQMELYRSD